MLHAKPVAPENQNERLKSRVDKIDDLPTIPTIVYDILHSLEDREVNINELVEMVFRDQVLTSRLIRMANSPLYCRQKEVTTIKQAIVTLGINRVRILVFSCSVINIYSKKTWLFNPTKFWEHSFGCAVTSENLAVKIGYKDKEKAYLGGLVHDLGELAMSLHFPEEFREVLKKVETDRVGLCEAELDVFGVDHSQFGRWLAEKWNFPLYLSEVIGCHHSPAQAELDPVLASLIGLGEAICKAEDFGYGLNQSPEPLLDVDKEESWRVLIKWYPNLRAEEFQDFMKETKDHVRAIVRSIFKS